MRVGGHTVTYRGVLSVTERDPGHFTLEARGAEVRGSGSVKLSLELRLTEADGGTRLEFTAESTADGRAAAFDPEASATAGHRLLDRAAAHLAAVAGTDEPGTDEPVADGEAADGEVTDAVAVTDVVAESEEEVGDEPGDPDLPEVTEVTASVFDAEVPPLRWIPSWTAPSKASPTSGTSAVRRVRPPRPPMPAAR